MEVGRIKHTPSSAVDDLRRLQEATLGAGPASHGLLPTAAPHLLYVPLVFPWKPLTDFSTGQYRVSRALWLYGLVGKVGSPKLAVQVCMHRSSWQSKFACTDLVGSPSLHAQI